MNNKHNQLQENCGMLLDYFAPVDYWCAYCERELKRFETITEDHRCVICNCKLKSKSVMINDILDRMYVQEVADEFHGNELCLDRTLLDLWREFGEWKEGCGYISRGYKKSLNDILLDNIDGDGFKTVKVESLFDFLWEEYKEQVLKYHNL